MRLKKYYTVVVILALIMFNVNDFVLAQSSANYSVGESSFSTGGNRDAKSTNYGTSGIAGLNTVSNSSSTNFDTVAGLITPDVPFLEFFVTGAIVDLGVLNSSTTSSGAAKAGACACSFYVRTYLSSSYVVTTITPPPTSGGGAVLTAKVTQALPSSSQSVEEFGMNLVANTSPAIGANPVNQPNGSFADGIAEPGYATQNLFKYSVGDIIARAAGLSGSKAWGMTEYTISYIAKSNTVTPAGLYTMNQVLVATATY